MPFDSNGGPRVWDGFGRRRIVGSSLPVCLVRVLWVVRCRYLDFRMRGLSIIIRMLAVSLTAWYEAISVVGILWVVRCRCAWSGIVGSSLPVHDLHIWESS